MKRLIETGLMFGNLIHVASPALVERYNRALAHLTGRTTKLHDFHIDIAGYAPEIGEELDDPLYLNPRGVNRQFILLTTEQKTAPLLNPAFDFSRAILRRFIDENEAKLFALTATDAVVGELANSVYAMETPARLFDIRRIAVEADTSTGRVAHAQKLAQKIERFRSEPDAWWDDVLIAEMIGLAKTTGDVVANPVDLAPLAVDLGNFWTAHFGGLYVFRDLPHPAVIAAADAADAGDPAELGDLPVDEVLRVDRPNRIAQFLDRNDLVEPIVQARGIDAAAILRQKMDFVLVDAAAAEGLPIGHSRHALRAAARRLGPALPAEFQGLAALLRWAEAGGPWPRIASDHPAYFYGLRARPGPDRDLVNRLLAELTPLDVRQLFICHKETFYRLYRDWSPAKQDFVVDLLTTEYQVDKAGTRAALYGGEPGMAEPVPEPEPDPVDLIARVGPWGAVRGRR